MFWIHPLLSIQGFFFHSRLKYSGLDFYGTFNGTSYPLSTKFYQSSFRCLSPFIKHFDIVGWLLVALLKLPNVGYSFLRGLCHFFPLFESLHFFQCQTQIIPSLPEEHLATFLFLVSIHIMPIIHSKKTLA